MIRALVRGLVKGIYLLERLRGRRPATGIPQPATVKEVLVIELYYMGDVLFATPAVRALQGLFSDSRISALVTASGEPVLRHNPRIHGIVTANLDMRGPGNPLAFLTLIWRLRRRKFDVAVVLDRSSRSTIIAFLGGARFIAGVDSPHLRDFGFLVDFKSPAGSGGAAHIARENLALCQLLGAKDLDERPELHIPPETQERADLLLKEGGIVSGVDHFAMIHPGASWYGRRWADEKFAMVGDGVQARGLKVVVAGGPDDVARAQAIASSMSIRSLVLAGRTGLLELAGVMMRASLFIGLDSGPIHMASAVGLPAIGLYGPNTPDCCGPLGPLASVIHHELPCCPCLQDVCPVEPGSRCMDLIEVEDVLKAVDMRLRDITGPYKERANHTNK